MKKNRIFASSLAALLTFSLFSGTKPVSATNVYTASGYVDTAVLELADTLTYSENTKNISTNSYRQDYIFEYKPGENVKPVIVYGDYIYGRNSIEDIVTKLQAEGNTIIGGVNADFFSTSSGVPEGLTVTEGVLRCSDSYQSAVGILPDGSMFIGKPQLQMTLTSQDGYTVPITYINKVRTTQGVYLLNSDYREETGFTRNGVSIVLQKLDQRDITIGGSVSMKVISISHGSSSYPIPEDCMILTVSDNGPTDKITPVKIGDYLTLSVSSHDPRWNDVLYACGAGDILIENGVVTPGLQSSLKPRTVLGIKQDGSVVIMAIDGSQAKYSTGVSLASIASELVSMGCVSAVNLDGGGSTTAAVVYPGNTELDIANSPSDGSPRACSTYLFFLNTASRSGNPFKLYLYPYNAAVLAGAQISFEAKAVDNSFHPTLQNRSVSFYSNGGAFSGNTFIAGSAPGAFDILATAGNMNTNAKVTIINDTNRITVKKNGTKSTISSLSVMPGETIDLDAQAYYLNRVAYGTDNQFTWSVSENIGTINNNGIFTAASVKGLEGSINVSYGSKTHSIPVSVGRAPVTVEPFDNNTNWITEECNFTSDHAKVKFGFGAMELNYDLTDSKLSDDNQKYIEVSPTPALSFSNAPDYINLWVYGDNSKNLVTLNIQNSSGQILPADNQIILDYSGWRLMSFKLPSSAAKLASIVIIDGNLNSSGTLILDQMVASYAEPLASASNVEINFVSVDIGSLVAFVNDANGYSIKPSDIIFSIDGKDSPFAYDMASGLLSAAYTLDASSHRITITAKDSCGNINRKSYDIPSKNTAISSFSDMEGHWAASYAEFLASNGIITGVKTNGKLYFNPNNKTTRVEMAAIIARYLGLDIVKYASHKLPFADTEQIPSWAVPYVKAVYANGLMSGTAVDGTLIFNPNAHLTRNEALTILGRTLPQGYKESDLTFKDTDSIASWAIPHFKKLVALNIVGGYSDNTIKPNNNISRAEVATLLYKLF